MDVDRSLDEIVAAKRANRQRKPKPQQAKPQQANNGPNRGVGGNNQQQARPPRGAPTGPRQGQQQQQPQSGNIVGDKIIISGLPDDVSEAQIRELFTSTVGPLRSASLSYDSKGKSKGIATIEFKKAQDATKAYDQYNGRLIDGKRPMKVEVVVDPSRVPAAPLSSRLGNAPRAVSATVAAAGGNARQARNAPAKGNAKAPAAGAGAGAGAEGGAAGAGRGRKRGPKGPKPAKRAPATLDELDAEMADYQANKGAAPAAAAPVAEAAPATVA